MCFLFLIKNVFTCIIYSSSLLLLLFIKRDTNVVYWNAVVCLGQIGVQLVQIPQTQELILQFLQQNLNHTKLLPELEIKSLEQLGCMLITGSVR